MIKVLQLCVLSLAVATALPAGAEGPGFVTIGNDRLTFPAAYALPSKNEAEQLKKYWSEDASIRKELGDRSPFLDSVHFSYGFETLIGKIFSAPRFETVVGGALRAPRCLLLRRDTGIYASPQWDNLGYFLRPLQTRAQFKTAISVLHAWWVESSLDGPQFRRVLDAIRTDKRRFPLKIIQADVDYDILAKKCFSRDGVWCADFIVIDDASVVEYKYAIDSTNRIAHASHILVCGPVAVPFSLKAKDTSLISGSQFGYPPESAAHKEYSACGNLLRRAAFLDKRKKELLSDSAEKRREAARAVWSLEGEAVGALPELRKTLFDADWCTRYYSAMAMESLGEAGRIAVPELRKAIHDEDLRVREVAARALFSVGAADARIEAANVLGQIGGLTSCDTLERDLKDQTPAVRAAATAAIDAIERTHAK